MKLLGAKEVAQGTGVAKKGIKGVGDATRTTGRESTRASKANSVLTRSYGALGKAAKWGIGILGVSGVFALQAAITNTTELAKVTTGLNRNLGLSVKVGSEWAAVAHARGIASTALNMSFTKLGKSFVEANRKGGTARTGLNMLGITQAQTERGAKDFSFALDLVAKKFGEAEAGPKRQAAAMALLGKGYSTVLPLFSSGKKGLQEQLQWAEKYGVTLDGKTNNALMDLVTAQRESKVAMLGLQLAFTTALLPAIQGGFDEMQKFIAVLNSDDLTRTEKITRIEKQFEGLQDTLIKFVGDALPRVAEQGGELGIELGKAVWRGFENSSLAGKLVIGAWLFKFMGGFGLLATAGAKVGGKLATSLGKRFLATVVPYFAAAGASESLGGVVGIQMGSLKGKFKGYGGLLGGVFGRAFLFAAVTLGLVPFMERAENELKDKLGGSTFDNMFPDLGDNWGQLQHTFGPDEITGHLTDPPGGGKSSGGGGRGGSRPSGPKGPKGGGPKPRRNLSEMFNPNFNLFIDGKQVEAAVSRQANRRAARA